jgi:hypothetical protein
MFNIARFYVFATMVRIRFHFLVRQHMNHFDGLDGPGIEILLG